MRQLFLFDFDGTLTHKDTLFDFLRFTHPKVFWPITILFVPLFILSKLKIISAGWVKQNYISAFLKGKSKKELEQLANAYFTQQKDQLLRKNALDMIRHLPKGTKKVIVSASLDIWTKPFAEFLDCDLICTQAKYKDDVFTGKFATPNCNNEQKKLRIEQKLSLNDFDEILVFGDSKGDNAMYSIGTKHFHRYFH